MYSKQNQKSKYFMFREGIIDPTMVTRITV